MIRVTPPSLASRTGVETETEGEVAMAEKRLPPPPLFAVWLLNDDFTPMDFVVWVLMEVFNKSQEEAEAIMLKVHNNGRGLCGIYSLDMAETLATRVMDHASKASHPLRCIVEPVAAR